MSHFRAVYPLDDTPDAWEPEEETDAEREQAILDALYDEWVAAVEGWGPDDLYDDDALARQIPA